MLVVFLCMASALLGTLEGATVDENAFSREERDVDIDINTYGSGVVYTRWGKLTCPDTQGTQLVYAGRAGGTQWSSLGGAANYICLPDNPQYLSYASGVQGFGQVLGTEFVQPLSDIVTGDNVACAVCYVQDRSVQLMIPARYECPTAAWTREYYGYLVSEAVDNPARTMYECVDVDPDTFPGESAINNPALMYHVEAVCNGLECPPYDTEKELTCVVCTM